MKKFNLKSHSKLPPEKIFALSTDIENFQQIMPNHFKSLDIIDENKYGMIVNEKIDFLGMPMNIRTKHVIIPPNIHEVHILSGPASGTSFIESYVRSGSGTLVSIDVNLQFHGFLKFLSFLHDFVAQKMAKTMNEFIQSAEAYSSREIIQR